MKHTQENVIKVAEAMAESIMDTYRHFRANGDEELAERRFWEWYGIVEVLDMFKSAEKFKENANIFKHRLKEIDKGEQYEEHN